MSWHFSQALEEAYLEANSSAGEPCAEWKSIPSVLDDSCSAKMKATCHRSPFGMMFVPLADKSGEAVLTWFRVDFLAKISQQRDQEQVWREVEVDCGKNFPESLQKPAPLFYSSKTAPSSSNGDLILSYKTLPKWGSMQNGVFWAAPTWALGINENEYGFSLPTIGANEYKGSSKVRFRGSPQYRGAKMSEGLRICETDPIYTHPNFAEEAMGWPTMWTASTPLATDKFQSWLQQHSVFSPPDYYKTSVQKTDWLSELEA